MDMVSIADSGSGIFSGTQEDAVAFASHDTDGLFELDTEWNSIQLLHRFQNQTPTGMDSLGQFCKAGDSRSDVGHGTVLTERHATIVVVVEFADDSH
jgi:hypothetical protein